METKTDQEIEQCWSEYRDELKRNNGFCYALLRVADGSMTVSMDCRRWFADCNYEDIVELDKKEWSGRPAKKIAMFLRDYDRDVNELFCMIERRNKQFLNMVRCEIDKPSCVAWLQTNRKTLVSELNKIDPKIWVIV